MTTNPVDLGQGDRLAGEDKHMNEPMSPITPEAVERLREFAEDGFVVLLDRAVPLLKTDLRSLLSTLQAVRGALEAVEPWLTAALECKSWSWDADQHEAATACRDLARQALSTIQNGGGEGGDFDAGLSSAKRADHDGERSAGRRLHDCWQEVLQPHTATGERVQWGDFDPEQQAIWDAAARAFSSPLAVSEPVALAHVRLEDDGLYATLEVLDGELLQPEHSPVKLYLRPAETALSGAQGTELSTQLRDRKTPSPEEE